MLQTLAPDEYVEDTIVNVYGHLLNYASYIEAKREGRTGLKKFYFSNWPAVNILFIFFNYYFNMFYSFIYLTIFLFSYFLLRGMLKKIAKVQKGLQIPIKTLP